MIVLYNGTVGILSNKAEELARWVGKAFFTVASSSPVFSVVCAGTVDMKSSNVTLFFKGILLVDFKIPLLASVAIFGGNLIFKGRFNFNVDIDITVAFISMVSDEVPDGGCMWMFVLLTDALGTIWVLSNLYDIVVTDGAGEPISSLEHELKVAVGLLAIFYAVLSTI